MDKQKELGKVAQEVEVCRTCSLAKSATHPVPGNGNPNAEIMLIGEAPGYWEDQKGIPFVGVAGKLLDELLASIDLSREKVFVTNVLKHRPPNNRDPSPEEVKVCQPFLERQINVIQPKVIITLGRFAMYHFLPLGKISRDHGQGKVIESAGQRLILIPMYHPAAALRAGEVNRQLKEDFKNIPAEVKRLGKSLNSPAGPEEKKPDKEEQLTLI
ncbi:MAG TPA: uracil-DNA glycosylase [Patescibacteria group bacterium]|nr:uracil-DNA glycosylase [Patescibacteria group bacterium]